MNIRSPNCEILTPSGGPLYPSNPAFAKAYEKKPGLHSFDLTREQFASALGLLVMLPAMGGTALLMSARANAGSPSQKENVTETALFKA